MDSAAAPQGGSHASCPEEALGAGRRGGHRSGRLLLGLAVTNNHVVTGATKLSVRVPGKTDPVPAKSSAPRSAPIWR